MENPKISVLIPVYGVEPYLRRCLDSVIHNTYRNLEIICVNDGSPDDCLEILREYEAVDSRIKVIDKPNGGLASARNAAIDAATGDYIAHVDSDDWVHHQYFACLMHAVIRDQGKTDIVMCGHIRTQELLADPNECQYDIELVDIRYGGWEMIRSNRNLSISVWGKLYKRSIIGDYRQPLQICMFEDQIYNAAIQAQNTKLRVAVMEEPLYMYFNRPNSIVNTVSFGGDNAKKQIRYLNEAYQKSVSQDASGIIGSKTCKAYLSVRYASMFMDQHDQEWAKNVRKLIQAILKDLNHNSSVSKKELLYISIMFYFPPLYRLFRIATDRTMFAWEREQKKRRKLSAGK